MSDNQKFEQERLIARRKQEQDDIKLISSKGKDGALAQLEREAIHLRGFIRDWNKHNYDEFGQHQSNYELLKVRSRNEDRLRMVEQRILFVKAWS